MPYAQNRRLHDSTTVYDASQCSVQTVRFREISVGDEVFYASYKPVSYDRIE